MCAQILAQMRRFEANNGTFETTSPRPHLSLWAHMYPVHEFCASIMPSIYSKRTSFLVEHVQDDLFHAELRLAKPVTLDLEWTTHASFTSQTANISLTAGAITRFRRSLLYAAALMTRVVHFWWLDPSLEKIASVFGGCQ